MRGCRIKAGLASLIVALALCLGPAAVVRAQGLGLPDSPVLVVDPGRLFAETRFGQRVAAELEAQGVALAAENRRIEAELTAEEKALTERRKTMTADAFRQAADAFDVKVQRNRAEQEAKARELGTDSDNAQRRFLGVARPVLEALMVESGAAALLDVRTVLLSAAAVDITDEAVRRIDMALGDGSNVMPAETDPAQTPEPAPELPKGD